MLLKLLIALYAVYYASGYSDIVGRMAEESMNAAVDEVNSGPASLCREWRGKKEYDFSKSMFLSC